MLEILISSLFNTLHQRNYTGKGYDAFVNHLVSHHSPEGTL